MKLQTRFALAGLVLAESALLGAAGFQQALERRHLERKQREHQLESVRRLARVAKDASLEFNEVFLINYLKALKESSEVLYAALVDPDGKVRIHSAMLAGADAPGRPWDGPRHEGPDEQVQVRTLSVGSRPAQDWSLALRRGSAGLGEVHLGFDAAALERSLAADLADSRRRVALVALAMTLAALGGAAWMVRQLHDPLAALHEGARRVGAGDLDYRIEVARSDELGDLAQSFNQMASALDKLNKFREQLMASITHDLRSPLTAIRGHAELLLTDAEASAEERRESAQLIYDNARRMSAMSDDLTDLAKLQMGRLEVAKRPWQVADSVEAVRGLMRVVADRLQVRLETDLQAGLPAVQADPAHLERVLTNLIANALKFTPAGGEVRVAGRAGPHHLSVTVSDTGTGIPPRKLKTLFSKFIDGKSADASRSGLATGLGLSICRELVEAHGGKIWAESEWRRGARIHFTLPLGETACSGAC
ncbi:MAG: HAMP domain-containing histidine kinase [Elusimicrobia bacterium]|nr:HAMP domain-containing histidine kinase [Elusimicrobiota bacterium]